MSNDSNVKDRIASLIKADNVSPYRLGKIESALRGKTIPPQKIYGYVRQGYISSSLNALGKMQISKEEATRYLLKTMANNA